MAEYGGTVLWSLDDDNVGPIEQGSMGSLGLPPELQKDLQRWAEKYDATLNEDYPPDSGFVGSEEEDFENEGKRLWHGLEKALGSDWEVFYFSSKEGRLLK